VSIAAMNYATQETTKQVVIAGMLHAAQLHRPSKFSRLHIEMEKRRILRLESVEIQFARKILFNFKFFESFKQAAKE